MRFLLVALLSVISVFSLLFGLAQRTIWAPANEFAQSIHLQSSRALVLIPNKVLTAHVGAPTIFVRNGTTAFVASGRESDVNAWIGTSEFDQLNLSNKKLDVETKIGVGNLESPAGSDLWRTEAKGARSASLKVSAADEGAVLIASDGIKAAANDVSIVWTLPQNFFWSNFWMIIGGLFLVGALVVYFITYRDMRRKRRPKRRTPQAPKPPKYRFKAVRGNAPVRGRRSAGRAFIAIPLTGALLLSGCSTGSIQSAPASSSPSPSVSTADVPPPALTQAQIERIVGNTAQLIGDADLTADKKVLAPRVTGPALEQRSANFVLRSRSTKIQALPPIVGKPISLSLPSASNVWPKTLMVVTDSKADNTPPQMLVFQQETPRAKYMLWYNMALMPGTQIPEVPATELGAIPVDAKSLFLKLSPTSIATAYGDVINKGQSSLSYGLFDLANDEFYTQVSADQADKTANSAGKISFDHRLGNPTVLSLATRNSGALVAVYMTDTYKIKPKNRASAIAVSGSEKLMLGTAGSTRGIQSIYGDMLLFYVPSLNANAKIKLLGVTQGLVSVRSL